MKLRKQLGINKNDWTVIVKAAAQVGLEPDDWIATVIVGKSKYCIDNPGRQTGVGPNFISQRW